LFSFSTLSFFKHTIIEREKTKKARAQREREREGGRWRILNPSLRGFACFVGVVQARKPATRKLLLSWPRNW
jgi:hypothetical protein